MAHGVNTEVAAELGPDAERLGSLDRVTAERHGAIRVGTPQELAQVGRIFAAMGMHPTGYYDLRDASASSVPVVSTASLIDENDLAANPFRVFTSLLVSTDRRFFSADLSARLQSFLAGRELFPPRLLTLADRASADGELDADDAEAAFALSDEPIDRTWYAELEHVSAVAADIGGVTSTHINHLTPRVLDIDALYTRMSERGITMIDAIQGPPRWSADVLLRQTSFRALAEPRQFPRTGRQRHRGLAARPVRRGRGAWHRPDPSWPGPLRPGGRDRRRRRTRLGVGRALPQLGDGTVHQRPRRLHGPGGHGSGSAPGDKPRGSVEDLIRDGWLRADPVVYEDFLRLSGRDLPVQSHRGGQQGRHRRWRRPGRGMA